MTNCELCGEPMPPNEQMFKYHGYSGGCPKPPITSRPSPAPVQARTPERMFDNAETEVAYLKKIRDQQDAEIARLTHFVGEVRKDRDAAICEIQRLYDIRGEQITELSQLREQLADALKAADAAFAERDRLRAENERKQEYIEELDRREAKLRAQVENLLTPEEAREAFRIYARPSELTPDKRTIYVAKLRRIAGSQP